MTSTDNIPLICVVAN